MTARKARSELRAQVVKALAHPSRILIAEALIDGEQCVCELTELVGADMSTVSKHLSIMKAAGLVEVEKRGLNVFYRLRCQLPGRFLPLRRQHQSRADGSPCNELQPEFLCK